MSEAGSVTSMLPVTRNWGVGGGTWQMGLMVFISCYSHPSLASDHLAPMLDHQPSSVMWPYTWRASLTVTCREVPRMCQTPILSTFSLITSRPLLDSEVQHLGTVIWILFRDFRSLLMGLSLDAIMLSYWNLPKEGATLGLPLPKQGKLWCFWCMKHQLI